MAIITVDRQGLLEDFKNWGGVSDSYVQRFIDKNKSFAGKVELSVLDFNDSINLTDSSLCVSVHAAFWCRFYREAGSYYEQAQALGAIQSLYYIARMLGLSRQVVMIHKWWQIVFPLHDMASPNMQFTSGKDISAIH